jgi:hypothetical protein
MGLTGLEPVTLRLSSACSNQLSYRPVRRLRREIFELRLSNFDPYRSALRVELLKSAIANRKSKMKLLLKSPITSVALRTRDLKRISDFARVELPEYDRQEQRRF